MRKISVFILGLFSCLLAYSNVGERVVSIDGWWNFKTDPYVRGEEEKWYLLHDAGCGWDKMPVPGNWELRNEYVHYVGKGWYMREFVTPEYSADNEDLSLYLEAVNINYVLWVNGQKVGEVTGGYFPHKFDIGKVVNPSGEKNIVAVCVDNNFRTGAYWSWGGIRRHVDLRIENKNRIEHIKVTAIPDLKTGKAVIDIMPQLVIKDTSSDGLKLRYEIKKDNKILMKGYYPVSEMPVSLTMPSKQVRLWHFDTPELYDLSLCLVKDEKVVYETQERFGIRKIEWDNACFRLNGEPVRCLGMNWVADDRLSGNTLPPEVYKKHLDDMRRLGVTMTRLSHMPLPEEVLDYIDEIGMMIIDEIPVWGVTPYASPNNEVPFSWLRQMVENHYNHPCVVGWSVGNEIGDQVRNPEVNTYVKKAVELVHSLDSTRPAMDVSNTAQSTRKNDPSEHSDMLAFNCYARNNYGKHAENVFSYYGPKPVFMTEFGCQLISENLESNFEREQKALSLMRGKDFLFGASLWTYNDYRSTHRSPSPTWDNPVSENRAWGVVDAYGRRKWAYFQARKELAPLAEMTMEADRKACVVKMLPRQKLDLPAYVLRDYTLHAYALNANRDTVCSLSRKLPVINPGDEAFSATFKLKNTVGISMLKVVLENASGVELMECVKCYELPRLLEIKEIKTAASSLRIYFDMQDDADEYWAECVEENTGKKIVSDTLHFPQIEILKLKRDADYKVTLFARNGEGVTVSEPVRCTVKGAGYLPPVIKGLAAIDFHTGIGVGYSAEKAEYLFELEYSQDKDFTHSKRLLTIAKGAAFIPGLEKGKTYYVRMRSHYQYQQLSEWSPVCVFTL